MFRFLSSEPRLDGLRIEPFYIQAASTHTQTNNIPRVKQSVVVSAVTNNPNDFVVLPPIAEVPIGWTIILHCGAGSDFELRTPAGSNTKINNLDCDGTNEYFCTNNQTIKIIKRGNTAGWVAFALDHLGAVATAVVPDAVSQSASASLSPSSSASSSSSASLSPSSSASRSLSPSSSASASLSPSSSASSSSSASLSPSSSTSPSASLSPSSSASSSSSASLSPSSSASSSSSASLSPSASVSRSVSPSASKSPSASASA